MRTHAPNLWQPCITTDRCGLLDTVCSALPDICPAFPAPAHCRERTGRGQEHGGLRGAKLRHLQAIRGGDALANATQTSMIVGTKDTFNNNRYEFAGCLGLTV